MTRSLVQLLEDDPMDDIATVSAPSETAPAPEGGGWEDKVMQLLNELMKGKDLDPKTKKRLIHHGMKMLDELAGPSEPEVVEPEPEMVATEDDHGQISLRTGPQSGGEVTPSKKTEGAETRYAPGEGVGAGGVAQGRKETMEAHKRHRQMRESVDAAIQQLKDTKDPANIELAESFSKQFEDEFKRGQELLEKVDTFEAKTALQNKRTLALKLCKDAKLNEKVITEAFQTQLINAADEKEMKSLIEDRKYITSIQKPTSRTSYLGQVDNDKPPAKNGATPDGKTAPTDEQIASTLRRSRSV